MGAAVVMGVAGDFGHNQAEVVEEAAGIEIAVVSPVVVGAAVMVTEAEVDVAEDAAEVAEAMEEVVEEEEIKAR